jgi:NhaP-type Na+/H+ or K+/H+ antiporter
MITPVVLFAIAAVEGTEGLRAGVSLAHAVLDLVIGIAVGALIGAGGGRLLGWSRERGTSTVATRSLGVLALPILAYCVVLLLDGNGFVAAFVAGTAFTATAHWIDDDDASALVLTEALSQLLGFAVWLMFGLVAVPVVRDHVGWRELTFGVLSLTVLRMLPVAVALLGSGLTGRSVLFLGWFGPRGLASLVFALLAIEDLDRDGPLRTVTATITVTVLLSVVLHGVTADPLARRYGRWVERVRPPAELSPSTEPRPRRTWEHRHHGG